MADLIRLDGVTAARRRLAAMRQQVNRSARQATLAGAHVMEASIKTRAGEGGSHRRGTPTPAVKGRGPAVITGHLRRGVKVFGPRRMPGGWRAIVGPTAKYAGPVQAKGYPFVGPGVRDAKLRVRALFVAAFRRGAR